MDNNDNGKDDELGIDLGKVWPFRRKAEKGEKKGKEEEKESAEEKRAETEEPKESGKHEHRRTEHERKEAAEDEISIDFSKFKLFGKGKKEPQQKGEESREESHKEEGEIDLKEIGSKLKGLFSQTKHKPGSAKEEKEKEEGEEELAVDIKGVKNLFDKHKGLLLPGMAIILVVFLSVYIRMLPANMTYTEDWAKSSVNSMIRTDIANIVGSQYPNLPDAQKNSLIDEELNKALKSDSYAFRTGQFAGQTINIPQQVQQTANYFKSFFQDAEGNMYMPDIDPYYWFRYARNILAHGYPGDILKDGRSYDTFQLAPNGRYVEPEDTFHPYSIAYLYRILGIFNPKITLMNAEMLYPVIVSALTSILIFLIARRIIGDVGGLFAGAMMALNPASLTRSLYGHGDSDTWVLFLSVLATFLFLEALEAKKLKWQLGLASLAGLTIGVYARFWGGWWYIFDFLIAAAAIYTGYFIIAHRGELKKSAMGLFRHTELKTAAAVVFVFVLFSGVFVSLLSGPDVFLLSPVSSLGFTRIKAPVMESLWPNVLTTVAELNEGDVNGIINNAGGIFLFYIALLGIVLTMANRRIDSKELMFITISATYWLLLLLLRNNFQQLWFIVLLSAPIIARVAYAAMRSEPIDMKVAALLIIWFIVTIYASTKGIRFVMLLAPAFSIAFGVTIGFLYKHLSSLLTKEMHINKALASAALLIISAMIFVYPTNVWAISNSVAKQDTPMINDAWYNALTAIRDNSSKTAIITSWWDFGHHFKALAERPVTFDGTTQGSPQAHWVGQILRTDNEEMAVGILRMLDCGGNNAFDEVQKTNDNDTVKSVTTLYDIFEIDRAAAKSKLLKKYGMTEQQAENVLMYSHCEPPEAFFIASEDMIGKAGVWAHFGSWNFERAYAWQLLREKPLEEAAAEMQTKFNYTREQAEQTYFDMQAISNDAEANSWVSPWPSYGQIDSCTKQGSEAICNNGMRINLTDNDVSFNTPQGIKHPKFVAYLTDNDVKRKVYEKDVGIDLSATVIPEGDGYKLIVAAPELNASMFTRMFFMQGHSLKHFKLLTYQRSITGAEIYVYKVDWKGGEPNVKKELVKKDTVRAGDKVSFNYIGYIENGTVFDSSVHNWQSRNITKDNKFDENASPFTFTAGNQEIIPGLEEQMVGMRKGEEKVIKVPPEKAYGTNPASHPLGNKTLYFRTRIEDIQ